MDHWVMDYETMTNFFCGVFEHYKTKERKIFVVHDLRNDFGKLVDFLHQNRDFEEMHISYNGLAFDAQITEYILQHEYDWSHLKGCEIAHEIYKKAQDTIERSKKREWLEFYEGKMQIRQLDLFKLNHWDNPAKRSSLKWIQFSMDWENLQDMPLHHDTPIHTQDQIDSIIGYCINDVESTKAILYKSKEQIELRKTLTKEYGINLYSASEPKISKELFLLFLSDKTGIPKKEIKYSRTNRSKIYAKDIILPYVHFKDVQLQNLLNSFMNAVIDPNNTKGSLNYSVNYCGVKTDFGLGGVHGARDPGVYKSEDGMVIMSSDVKSYYPNLAIRNGWSPKHIPKKEFCELYEWFYDERLKIPKSDPRNYVYKIILNSTYGLSNDKFSFLYDPQFTMQITINGQLSLMMLYEMIVDRIPGSIPIMQNTDGLETIIPEEYIDEYMKICEEWEQMTQLVLEHDQYQKIVLADVNNYIAVHNWKELSKEDYEKTKSKIPYGLFKEENGKYYHAPTKCKGRFEFDGLALHKNKSALVIRKALYQFFVHNVSPESYVASNTNIFDYCIGKKIKGDWSFKMRFIKDQVFTEEPLQPTIRYYIANNGVKIIKCNNTDGREIQVESGRWMIRGLNKFVKKEWKEYDVDTKYYLQAIYKEIDNIAGSRVQQLTIF